MRHAVPTAMKPMMRLPSAAVVEYVDEGSWTSAIPSVKIKRVNHFRAESFWRSSTTAKKAAVRILP